MINVESYPYGEITSALKNAVNWLNKNTPHIQEFDYPDYGGLPDEIYNFLSSDEVDFIQDQIF